MISRIRPNPLQAAVIRLLAGTERRIIVEDPSGIVVYIDPYNFAGLAVARGGYEPHTLRVLAELLTPGDVFLDVGANEGIISAFAGKLVGDTGRVISIEPQPSLIKLIRINAALNNIRSLEVVNAAFGGPEGEKASLNLFPEFNTGASSMVYKHRLSFGPFRKIVVPFTTLESVMKMFGVPEITLAKVDVEGYEPEVITSMLPNLAKGDVRHLLVDYHVQILGPLGKSPFSTHELLLDRGGMIHQWGDPMVGGYVLYRSIGAADPIEPSETEISKAANGKVEETHPPL